MPNNIITYTTCADPGVATSHKRMGGFAGYVAGLLVNSSTAFRVAVVGLIVAAAIFLIVANPITAVATFAFLIATALDVKDWYYNRRLLCIEHDVCTVGTVINQTKNNFDGDAVFNLLLAPYTQRECFDAMLTHFRQNEQLLKNPANYVAPYHTAIPDFSEYGALHLNPNDGGYDINYQRNLMAGYLKAIMGKDPHDKDVPSNIYNQFLTGALDRILAIPDGNGLRKDFYGHFYRKNADHITVGSALWNALPTDFDDTVNWQAPNGSISTITYDNPYERTEIQPMAINNLFKVDHPRLSPFLHCEIDGHVVAGIIDNAIAFITAFFIAYLAALLVSLVAGILAALAILLLILIWYLLGGTETGQAGQPGVDYEEEIDEEEDSQGSGDVVVTHGNWIMDTEHSQRFEIHPVKAYYILGKNPKTEELGLFDTAAELEKQGAEKFQNHEVTEELAKELCKLVSEAEHTDPPIILLKPVTTLLSYGMTTKYGGGAGLLVT